MDPVTAAAAAAAAAPAAHSPVKGTESTSSYFMPASSASVTATSTLPEESTWEFVGKKHSAAAEKKAASPEDLEMLSLIERVSRNRRKIR